MTERPILFSCYGCKVEKPLDPEHFPRSAKAANGLKTKCKACTSEIKKAHYARTRNEQRARQRRYQVEKRSELYAYNREWSNRRRAREWASVGTWLYPGDRIVVLRSDPQ